MYWKPAWKMLTAYSPFGGIFFLILNVGLTVVLPAAWMEWDWRVLVLGTLAWLLTVLVLLSVVGEWLIAWMYGAKAIKNPHRRVRLKAMVTAAHQAYGEDSTIPTPYLVRMIPDDTAVAVIPVGRHTILLTEAALMVKPERLQVMLSRAAVSLRMGQPCALLWILAANAPITVCLVALEIVRKLFGLGAAVYKRLFSVEAAGCLLTYISGVLAVPMWLWIRFGALFFGVGCRRIAKATERMLEVQGDGEALVRLMPLLDKKALRSAMAFAAKPLTDTVAK